MREEGGTCFSYPRYGLWGSSMLWTSRKPSVPAPQKIELVVGEDNESPSPLSWETLICAFEGIQAIKGQGIMGHYPIMFTLPLGKLQISNSKYTSLESHFFIWGKR